MIKVIENSRIEFSSPISDEALPTWTLLVDDASNLKGSGIGIVLEGVDNLLIEHSLKFEFKSSNNRVG